MPDLTSLAARLDEAVRSATAIPQLSKEVELSLADAYAVQAAGIRLRVERGDPVVGVKLGFTSKAKAEQMGVSDVIIGVLTASTQVDDGGTFDLAGGVHPRIEPEIAFRLAEDIDPHDDSDPLDAVGDVASAMEIIDSRYKDFSFSLEDVVADNTSACGFVVGDWIPMEEARSLDMAGLEVAMTIDGVDTATGSSADILGNPFNALAAVKRMAATHGLELPAGSIVLAGAATAAVPLPPDATVKATLAALGSVSVRTSGGRTDG